MMNIDAVRLTVTFKPEGQISNKWEIQSHKSTDKKDKKQKWLPITEGLVMHNDCIGLEIVQPLIDECQKKI